MVAIPYTDEQWAKIEREYEQVTGDLGARYRGGKRHPVRVVAAWWAGYSGSRVRTSGMM